MCNYERAVLVAFRLGEIFQCAELFVMFLEKFLDRSVRDALQILAKRNAEISRGCVILAMCAARRSPRR